MRLPVRYAEGRINHWIGAGWVQRVRVRTRPYRGGPATLDRELELLGELSRLTDSLIRVPGTNWRVGLDPLIGLIPVVGDLVSSFIAFYILAAAARYGVPRVTQLRMGINLALDFLLGSIPFFGDAFDAWFKANDRNVALLRQRVYAAGTRDVRGGLSDWLVVGLMVACLLAILIGSMALGWYLLSQLIAWIQAR